MVKGSLGIASILAFIFSIHFTAFAGPDLMKPLRYDKSIPEACRDLDVENFDPDHLETITYGIEGSSRKGFTYEFPITRAEATQLWRAILKYVEQGHKVTTFSDPDMNQYFEILVESYENMDFDYSAEGEVLEALAIYDMKQHLSSDYFVTGSLSYRAKTAGELDIVVGRVDNCQVELVGEAKLGLKKINHAREQLSRFRSFIRTYAH